MAKKRKAKSNKQMQTERKPSKREKRMKFFVYLMIIAMVGSVLASGLAQIFS